MHHNMSQSKFRGAMMGALVGDCLGSPFEFSIYTYKNKQIVQKYLDDLESPRHSVDENYEDAIKHYTDDTAMIKSVAKTLIMTQPADYTTMAKLFTEEYLQDSERYYDNHVRKIFRCLKSANYKNVFEPASKQHHDKGACGNGGAMRIVPVALYYNNYKEMIYVAKKATQITHTHCLGVNGALLQCIAVRECLTWTGDFNAEHYINLLIDKLKKVDKSAEDYLRKLELIKIYLRKNLNPATFVKDEEIITNLGSGETALDSVPTAIYCFAQAHKGFPEIKTSNVFRRAIHYAISLGGDTDTIASMTGAIAGAYFGDTAISQKLIKHCEFKTEMLQLADELHDSAVHYIKRSANVCELM